MADLAVLDADPTTCAPDRIGAITVLATLVGGHPAHDPHGLVTPGR
ncbi:hypothetical protein [Streptomyces sp. NPDC059080]